MSLGGHVVQQPVRLAVLAAPEGDLFPCFGRAFEGEKNVVGVVEQTLAIKRPAFSQLLVRR